MVKKIVASLLLICLLFIAFSWVVKYSKANPNAHKLIDAGRSIPDGNGDQTNFPIVIKSPIQGATYKDSVRLKYTIQHSYSPDYAVRSTYYFDYSLGGLALVGSAGSSVEMVFTDLENMKHAIVIHAEIQLPNPDGSLVWKSLDKVHVVFFINNGIGPKISISGLFSYETNQASLNITGWGKGRVTYSLDGAANVSTHNYIDHDTYGLNFTDLSPGYHTLIAYASDLMGNTGVAQKTFKVGANPQPTIQPTTEPKDTDGLPLSAPIIIASTAIIAGSIMLLYYKKHKTGTQTYLL